MTAPVTPIEVDPSALGRTGLREYAIRFAFGGAVTAAVGIIGTAWGPVVAGLFLAFPAILMASLTLLAKHEMPQAAGVDAIGAAVGSVGLVAFGAVVWWFASRTAGLAVILAATIVWLVVALAFWVALDRWRRHDRVIEEGTSRVAGQGT